MALITPRPYQQEAIDATFNYFVDGNEGNPLIVLPTASGKSIVLAKFTEEVLRQWPNERIVILAHRKELLQQNFEKLIKIWPEMPAGIYSAGLRKRQLDKQVVVAGIQSIHNKAKNLGHVSLIIIDEAHLLSPSDDTMYGRFIADLKQINPALRIIGLTATPYRMTSGTLIDDKGLFTDICYEAQMRDLIKDGYLSPLISKMPRTQADLSDVKVRGGEYVAGEMASAMDRDTLTEQAIDEMFKYASDRLSWLIFCAGVDHSEHVAAALRRRGVTAESITGESSSLFREQHLRAFKEGRIRAITNCDVLTTGFDVPRLDALMLLRGTKSVGLYVQMVGRASRLSPETGKQDALILDFAGNIERHGPVDAVQIVKRPGGGGKSTTEVQTQRVKICPECRESVPIREPRCFNCGYVWPVEVKHDVVASDNPILSAQNRPRACNVSQVLYKKHEKIGKPFSLRATYHCDDGGGNLTQFTISEWVCFEHMGFARGKAVEWWKRHHRDYADPLSVTVPTNVDEALERVGELRIVKQLYVIKEGKFDRVLSVVFASDEETEAILAKRDPNEDPSIITLQDMEEMPF